jgi:undecaprenyl pyrophosphate phosphatase UppP
MNTLQAFIAILEGLTEYLPISSDNGFLSSYFGIQETILSNFSRFLFNSALFWPLLLWKKFFDFSTEVLHPFYLKLICSNSADFRQIIWRQIEAVGSSYSHLAIVLILGGVICFLLTVVSKSYNC